MGGSKVLFGMALASALLFGVTAIATPSTAEFIVESTAPANQFVSGNLTLTNDKSGNGALVSVSGLIPGDTATRVVTITNTGTIGFTYTAAATATANTLLWSDATNGLRVSVYRCPSSTACTNTAVLYSGALKNLATAASSTVAVSGVDYLTFVFSLPTTADNTFRALTQDFTVTFTATQLAGAAR